MFYNIFLQADVFIPITSDPFENKFYVNIHDAYMALLASSNSAAGPDGITESLLQQLAPVLLSVDNFS